MKQLRALRMARGLSQNALAAVTGIAATTISHYEHGRRSPSMESLGKLADALKCTTDELLGRVSS